LPLSFFYYIIKLIEFIRFSQVNDLILDFSAYLETLSLSKYYSFVRKNGPKSIYNVNHQSSIALNDQIEENKVLALKCD
jgi:hypothetical protein